MLISRRRLFAIALAAPSIIGASGIIQLSARSAILSAETLSHMHEDLIVYDGRLWRIERIVGHRVRHVPIEEAMAMGAPQQ